MAKAPKEEAPKEEAPKEEAPKAEAKGSVVYFKNKHHASLTVISDMGDGIDPATIKSERFTAYYDTFKGDVIRVGYLATSDKEVIKRCKADGTCETVEKKEYDEAVKDLQVAPIPAV